MKGNIPCHSVLKKLQLFNLSPEFQDIRKLDKVLIAKWLLFKKVTIMLPGQMTKIASTICNVPIDTVDITNLLARPVDSSGLVIVKLKRKLKYHSLVLFESVRPTFLQNILNYLKNNGYLYQGVAIDTANITPGLISVGFTGNVNTSRTENFDSNIETNNLISSLEKMSR